MDNRNRSFPEDLSDEDCIKRFKEHKEEAVFNCLLNRHIKSIRRIAFSVTRGTEDDIEDIIQETAFALYKGLPGFSFNSNFSTYLYRLCRNKAIDHIRRNERNRKLVSRIINMVSTKDEESPDTVLEKKDIKSSITAALFELPETERTLIVLKDVEHKSLKEISAILKIPEGTVKSKLHRARVRAAENYRRKEYEKR